MSSRLAHAASLAGLLAAALVSACASNKPRREPAVSMPEDRRAVEERTTLVNATTGRVTTLTTRTAARAVRRVLPLPLDSALLAVVRAYEAMELGQPQVDAQTGTVSATRPGLRGRLGDKRLSALMHCGSGLLGRPLADEYQVTLVVTSQVERVADSRSEVATVVSAVARAPTGDAPNSVCQTYGRLERLVNDAAASPAK